MNPTNLDGSGPMRVLHSEQFILTSSMLQAGTLLSLRLISGQHLPNASDRQAGEIIEPYVKINIHGHPVDTAAWVSSVVPRNGFNPLWEETAEFEIKYPELALVEFKAEWSTRHPRFRDLADASFPMP